MQGSAGCVWKVTRLEWGAQQKEECAEGGQGWKAAWDQIGKASFEVQALLAQFQGTPAAGGGWAGGVSWWEVTQARGDEDLAQAAPTGRGGGHGSGGIPELLCLPQ